MTPAANSAQADTLPGPADDAEREDDIHIACVLRFDGHRYLQTTGFDAEAALAAALPGGLLPPLELERFAMYFLLQRLLYKWGGEREPRDGRYWRLFRTLFLSLAASHVPLAWRPEDDSRRLPWRHTYRPRLMETVAFIRRIHRATQYREV